MTDFDKNNFPLAEQTTHALLKTRVKKNLSQEISFMREILKNFQSRLKKLKALNNNSKTDLYQSCPKFSGWNLKIFILFHFTDEKGCTK